MERWEYQKLLYTHFRDFHSWYAELYGREKAWNAKNTFKITTLITTSDDKGNTFAVCPNMKGEEIRIGLWNWNTNIGLLKNTLPL